MPKNHAYIDGQNLIMGINSLGWDLDLRKFRVYLKDKYKVDKAYYFIGFIPENQTLYSHLQSMGYILIFKPIVKNSKGEAKGNIDADLVLNVMVDYNNKEFDKAFIVTSDGDFYSVVDYLYKNNKLEAVLSPHKDNCSILLKKVARERIQFMDKLKTKLEYKKSTA